MSALSIHVFPHLPQYCIWECGDVDIDGETDISHSDIPLVILFFFGWKLFKKTKWIPLTEIPIREALDDMRDNPETPIPPPKGWQKVNILWG